jgi:hypothetical protein
MEDLVPKHPTEIEGGDLVQDLNGKHMVIEPVKDDFNTNPKPESLEVASEKAARKAEKRRPKQKAAKQKVMEQRKAKKQLQLKQKVGAPAATKTIFRYRLLLHSELLAWLLSPNRPCPCLIQTAEATLVPHCYLHT